MNLTLIKCKEYYRFDVFLAPEEAHPKPCKIEFSLEDNASDLPVCILPTDVLKLTLMSVSRIDPTIFPLFRHS